MNFSALLPGVLPHVPGCPDPLAEDAIRNSVIEFCQRAHVWQETLEPITPVTGVTEYDLILPASATLAKILEGDVQLDLAEETVTFGEVPAEAVTLKVALKPSRSATSFPNRIGERHGEAIASGALARLLAIPGKDWSNPGLAGYHHGVFEREVGNAVSRVVRNYTHKSLSVRPYAG